MKNTELEETKEIIESIVFCIATRNRKEMIEKIFHTAGDEFESIVSVKLLAIKNKNQLRETLKEICNYYLNQIV